MAETDVDQDLRQRLWKVACRDFGVEGIWRNCYILLFPALWTYYLWKITGMVSEWAKAIDFSIWRSHIFFSLLEGPPISALLHPCRLAHVMTQLDIVCSCAKLFIQLFWMRARCKMKSTLCILNFSPILHKLAVCLFVSSLCNKVWPSYLILGPDVWSCVKLYVDILVGTFW